MAMFIYLSTAFLLSILATYTAKLQEATLHWGRILAGQKSFDFELNDNTTAKSQSSIYQGLATNRGFQDVITPQAQTYRNVIYVIGLIALLIFGFYYFHWYIPIVTILGIYLIGGQIRKLLPAVNSDYFKNIILKSLIKKCHFYYKTNRPTNAKAIERFIAHLEVSQSDTITE